MESNTSLICYGIALLVMLVAGLYGGLVNFYLESDIKNKSMKKSIILGIGASLMVPLFLKVISSDIFDLQELNYSNIFIFFGLCMFASIASKRFITSLSEKLLKDTQEALDKVQKDVFTSESRKKDDNRALNLIERIFEDDLDQDEEPLSNEKIKETIKSTTYAAKVSIFFKARRYRHNKTKDDKAFSPKLIPIFEALIECDDENKFHRNHAQLAYVYRDQVPPNNILALTEIENAIKIRNSIGEKRFKFYEFFKSLCKIDLDTNFILNKPSSPNEIKEVLNDLKEASTNVVWHDAINKKIKDTDSNSSKWMKINGINKKEIL